MCADPGSRPRDQLSIVVLFWKPLRVTTFDPQLADSLGMHSRRMHYAIAALVAVTSVASF